MLDQDSQWDDNSFTGCDLENIFEKKDESGNLLPLKEGDESGNLLPLKEGDESGNLLPLKEGDERTAIWVDPQSKTGKAVMMGCKVFKLVGKKILSMHYY